MVVTVVPDLRIVPSPVSDWLGEEVMAMSTNPERLVPWPSEPELSTEELARRQGVGPVASVHELAQPDLWDSDEDYEAFLTDLYASRRSDLA